MVRADGYVGVALHKDGCGNGIHDAPPPSRRVRSEDHALLTDLAQHPEKRESPLSWGLQFIVRGDVLFDDGSVATLDELCDEAGVPRLPYLEDLPDELEVDWRD